jgi:hypothetical protein
VEEKAQLMQEADALQLDWYKILKLALVSNHLTNYSFFKCAICKEGISPLITHTFDLKFRPENI